MTVNLLTKRLKAARSELTNLKTASTRGLGFLRVYGQNLTLTDAPGSGFHELDVTVTLDSSFAPYPFVQLLPGVDSNYEHSLEIDGFTYQDQYHVRYHLLYGFGVNDANFFRVVSTSPITNITYNWTS